MSSFSIEVSRGVTGDFSDWMNDTIFLIPNWKWIGAIVVVTTGFAVRGFAQHFILHIKSRYGQHHKLHPAVNYWLSKDVHFPLAWLAAALVWHIGLQGLNVHVAVEHALTLLIHLLVLINLMRLAYLGAESAGLAMEDWVKISGGTLDGQLAPFATKVLKIIVITLGFLLSLQSLGFNVGAVLAGLGIGSLALALAAQDTAANLFGSITIILDRPFQLRDYIKIGDTEGLVEEVGFRSTQIRTPTGSIVTIPNSVVAKERIENLGARPTRRLKHILGINANTPPELVHQFIETLRSRLSSHALLDSNDITVNLQSFGDFDLKILIVVFVKTSDANTEAQVQQEVLLEIIRLANVQGVNLPYPTQLLHIASLPKST